MKKSINRTVCGLTAVVTMGALVACFGGQGETEAAVPSGSEAAGNTESTAQQGETQAEVRAMVIWGAFDNQFRSGFCIIMQNGAEKLGGITLDMQDAANDVSMANSKLRVALSKKTDVVAICAPDRESTENIVEKCDADGVSAVSLSMEPMEDTMKRYDDIQYMGAQVKQSGEMCAQALINYWNDKKDIADKNGDGRLQLVILQGEIGQQDATLRTDAYKETLEKSRIDYEILVCDTANWNQAQALDKMNARITAYGIDGIEGVLCNNDSTAMGTVQVCINNGYNPGDAEKFVPIMGIDVNINVLEAMKVGSSLGTVLNDRKSRSDAIINVIKAVHTGTETTEDVAGVDCTVDGKHAWVPYVVMDESNLSATLEDMLVVAQSEQGIWRKQMEEYRLKTSNMFKPFPGVKVLDNIKSAMKLGSVHALISENGAGKSTLVKRLSGLYHPGSGIIEIGGRAMDIKNPNDTLKNGIPMTHQELNPVPYRNAMDNTWAGRSQTKGVVAGESQMMEKTRNPLRGLDLDMDAITPAKSPSVLQTQAIEAVKAVLYNAKIIIMDEPTSSLIMVETQHLFKTIGKLRKEGRSIIYILHKPEEIFEIADEITMMGDGQCIGAWDVKDITIDQLIGQMAGGRMDERFPVCGDVRTDEVMLRAENFTSADPYSFKNVSSDLHRGEILGAGKLVGAQKTELIEAIFGLCRIVSGELTVNGKTAINHSSQDTIRNGFVLLTEGHRATGIIPILSVWDNTLAVVYKKLTGNIPGYIYTKKLSPSVDKVCTDLDVRMAGTKTLIKSPSGGNQQKVPTGRWLLADYDVTMSDEPTRGVDVGAKYGTYRIMQDLVKKGKAITMASSEMPESLGMSDRTMIMCAGKQTGISGKKEATQIKVMRYAIQFDDKTKEGVSA